MAVHDVAIVGRNNKYGLTRDAEILPQGLAPRWRQGTGRFEERRLGFALDLRRVFVGRHKTFGIGVKQAGQLTVRRTGAFPMVEAVLLPSFRQGFNRELSQANFNSYLLIGLIFSIPFSTSVSSILSLAILVSFLLKADFRNSWNQIRSNQIVIACFLFVGLNMAGLMWTSDLAHGLEVLKKQWKFIFVPVCMLCVRKEHVNYYIGSLILAMTISVAISYGIWLEMVLPINRATIYNPVPFGTHITYNVLLALAIYLLACRMLFDVRNSIIQQGLYLFVLVAMVVNMFLTGGRSGQAMFFAAIVVLCFQYFGGRFFKASAVAVVIILSILVMAYSFSDLFRQRLLGALSNRHISTQERIAYAMGGLKIFSNYPVVGVGTGDLPVELKIVEPHHRPDFYRGNPHNMYVMVMVQFGILGLASLLYIFYVQIRHAFCTQHVILRQVGVAFPLLFLVVNFGESYLFVHGTQLLFAVFSSILYKDM